jgi:hypothetical protein
MLGGKRGKTIMCISRGDGSQEETETREVTYDSKSKSEERRGTAR